MNLVQSLLLQVLLRRQTVSNDHNLGQEQQWARIVQNRSQRRLPGGRDIEDLKNEEALAGIKWGWGILGSSSNVCKHVVKREHNLWEINRKGAGEDLSFPYRSGNSVRKKWRVGEMSPGNLRWVSGLLGMLGPGLMMCGGGHHSLLEHLMGYLRLTCGLVPQHLGSNDPCSHWGLWPGSVVLTWGDFVLQGHFSSAWRHHWLSPTPQLSQLGAGGLPLASSGESRDAAEHPAVHSTASTTRNCLAPDTNCAKAEKLWPKFIITGGWQNDNFQILWSLHCLVTGIFLKTRTFFPSTIQLPQDTIHTGNIGQVPDSFSLFTSFQNVS